MTCPKAGCGTPMMVGLNEYKDNRLGALCPKCHSTASVPICELSVGFTGSREGMTAVQRVTVERTVRLLGMTEAHEGDCLGSDADFFDIVVDLLQPERIFAHLPDKRALRAFRWKQGVNVMAPKPYLARNHDIVLASQVLVATPSTVDEVVRSGTWSTIRDARRMGKMIVIVPPGGEPIYQNIDARPADHIGWWPGEGE